MKQYNGKLLPKIEEITVGQAQHHVITYIRSLLIEKDSSVHKKIPSKFLYVFVCLSYSDLFNFW